MQHLKHHLNNASFNDSRTLRDSQRKPDWMPRETPANLRADPAAAEITSPLIIAATVTNAIVWTRPFVMLVVGEFCYYRMEYQQS